MILSLETLKGLATQLSGGDPVLEARFDAVLDQANRLEDPVFASVADPVQRSRIKSLQRAILDLRTHVETDLAPRLGIPP